MKFDIPSITRPLDLKDYAPEMDVVLQVWANPPRSLILQYWDAVKLAASSVALPEPEKMTQLEQAGNSIMGWLAVMWSAGGEDTRWPVEDVRALWLQSSDTDPALWPWVINRTMDIVVKHRDMVKKN
jgi:hypothetical protein